MEDIDSHFIPPEDLVSFNSKFIIDLGCNDGMTTEVYAERFPQALVLGVELVKHVSDEAARRVSKYIPRVLILNEAIGWPEGKSIAHIDNCSSVSTLTPYQGRPTTPVQVNVRSLDTILKDIGMDNFIIDFVKIDIEGAELLLFSGGNKWFDRTRCFIVECHSEEAIEIYSNLEKFTVKPLFSNPKFGNHLIALNHSDLPLGTLYI